MKYQLADNISLTQVDDEAVLLNLESGTYYSLNHVGALLMAHLQEQRSIEFASAAIVEHYQAPAATVAQDINVLVEQLLAQRLIVAL